MPCLERYTAGMKLQRLVLFLLLLAGFLVSCSPGHLGSNVIAFLRDGHLWTIDPNGANAFDTVAQDTAVIGYAWSPNHQLLAFRTLDSNFARTAEAQHIASNPITGQVGDLATSINTIGVDGGSPIPVQFSSSDVRFSQPIWNTTGTRLLYRQTPKTPPSNPESVPWLVSQNDQPAGIAIKELPGSYAIPSLSYVAQQQMALGDSDKGVFSSTLDGKTVHYLLHTPLPDHPLPATLERLLWQPAHQDVHFLYAVPAPSQTTTNTGPLTVQLLLGTLDGQNTILTTCTCTQFAWSPDGNSIIYSTGSNYTIFRLADHATFTITGVNGSVPYWSPDSQFLLLDGLHTLVLVQIVTKQQTLLLNDGATSENYTTEENLPTTSALLQPVANSIWAADSRHFLFMTRNRLLWQNTALQPGKGLYTAAVDNNGHPQDPPAVVDTGNDSQPGWTYQDANTSFLY